ncbi:hypothetical protein BKA65DRAFT_482082 [Rhexocercosporidium sp. MPI-PUGE-AT-0058]|nr:hypothetical protein BKA65DRAFT_482082 [Rhexocercosporidium sp. MPI-PUGE-AT-0058]
MSKPSLECLSNELLIEIFSHVRSLITDWSTLSSLASISLSSKGFHKLVAPLLHSRVLLRDNLEVTVTAYLRTILDKPYLADFVEYFQRSFIHDLKLELACLTEENWFKQRGLTSRSPKIRTLLPDDRHGNEYYDIWYLEIYTHGDANAIQTPDWFEWEYRHDPLMAFFFILFAKNLRSLDFVLWTDPALDCQRTLEVLREAAKNQRALHTDLSKPRQSAVIKELTADVTSDFFKNEHAGEFNTEIVTVIGSNLKHWNVVKLLRNFSSLKVFEFEIHDKLVNYNIFTCILPTIREGLTCSIHCLEFLVLTCIHDVSSTSYYSGHFNTIGSLAEVGSLRVLEEPKSY